MKRDLLLDYLKLLAILVVVMIHLPETEQVRRWIFPLNANAVFATLSGMFVFSGASFGDWLKKRWHRLVLPYLIWEAVYLVVGIAFDLASHSFEMPGIRTVCQWIFWGGASVQLWFVATLFYVQLMMWALAKIAKTWLPRHSLEVILLLVAIVGIGCYRLIDADNFGNLKRFMFMSGYCSLGALLRAPYAKFIGNRFVSSRWGGVCQYTMGVYLCHFLFTRVVSMLYPRLLGVMPHVLAVIAETALAFGASLLFVHLTHRRFYWLWGMKK